jgi:hypothetical protein
MRLLLVMQSFRSYTYAGSWSFHYFQMFNILTNQLLTTFINAHVCFFGWLLCWKLVEWKRKATLLERKRPDVRKCCSQLILWGFVMPLEPPRSNVSLLGPWDGSAYLVCMKQTPVQGLFIGSNSWYKVRLFQEWSMRKSCNILYETKVGRVVIFIFAYIIFGCLFLYAISCCFGPIILLGT